MLLLLNLALFNPVALRKISELSQPFCSQNSQNPIALRTAKPYCTQSFGCSECNRIKELNACFSDLRVFILLLNLVLLHPVGLTTTKTLLHSRQLNSCCTQNSQKPYCTQNSQGFGYSECNRLLTVLSAKGLMN